MEDLTIKQEIEVSKFNRTSQKCIDFIPTPYSEELFHGGKFYYIQQ